VNKLLLETNTSKDPVGIVPLSNQISHAGKRLTSRSSDLNSPNVLGHTSP
jgi:hypothetical protein